MVYDGVLEETRRLHDRNVDLAGQNTEQQWRIRELEDGMRTISGLLKEMLRRTGEPVDLYGKSGTQAGDLLALMAKVWGKTGGSPPEWVKDN